MKIYELWIQKPNNDWELYETGGDELIDHFIRYIALNHPHWNYKTVLKGEK